MNDRYNLNIKKWGPAGWLYLFAAALQYPTEPTSADKLNYKQFFEYNAFVIPCKKCRRHYAENLKTHPLTEDVLASRKNIAQWINVMRNEVNKSNNKPEISFLQMLSDYMPPHMAREGNLIDEPDDMRELERIDNEKTIASLLRTRPSEPAVSPQRRKPCPLVWVLLIVVLSLFSALFIWCLLKSK